MNPTDQRLGPPPTRREDIVDIIHGEPVADPYRWLEDQTAPDTRAWLDAQNRHTRQVLDALPRRDALRQRLGQLMRIDSVGLPSARTVDGRRRYVFSKRGADDDLAMLYLREGRDGDDEVLIDPHPWSEDRTVSVDLQAFSDDGHLLVYGIRTGGADEVALQPFDLDRREAVHERFEPARYSSVSITPDRAGCYYSVYTPDGPRVYHHTFGASFADDPLVFGEQFGPGLMIGGGVSQDGRYLVLTVYHGSASPQTEIYYRRLDGPADQPFEVLVNDLEARFHATFVDDSAFVWTNWDAPNGKLLKVDLAQPQREHWTEVLPETEAVLEDVQPVGGRLFASYLDNVVSRVRIFSPDGEPLGELEPPTLGTLSGVYGRWDSDEGFYVFSSFHVPPTIYRYAVPSGESSVWAAQSVPLEPAALHAEQVWYASKDGTRIPMFLLYRRDLDRDGRRPVYLTGYGGFNAVQQPGFNTTAIAWAEQGGVFAVPCLRGGGEFGEAWHQAGMLANKQNVFDDFIAAGEWLIEQGYTSPEHLAIVGGSNGGLLVGAAMTQRPDLFAAVVCTYPLLDMIRYHQFLVASFWVPEYGSSDDPEQFGWLHAYSPYHNVVEGTDYPAVMFMTGDADTRVDPLHARKMAALVQHASGSDRPVLLHYDTKRGHSGGRPLSERIEEAVDVIAFLLAQTAASD